VSPQRNTLQSEVRHNRCHIASLFLSFHPCAARDIVPSVEAKRSNRRALQVKRVYDPPSSDDGIRVLVDRLWPRGLTKTTAAVDLWLKDIAPSVPLRRWFNNDPSPSRWSEFTERYFEELDTKKPAVDALAGAIRRGRVTLLFGARDPDHNNAVALFSYFKRVID
jgi:uncharacterized protein YeaO (DUF488 family)